MVDPNLPAAGLLFAAVVVEATVGWARGTPVYRLSDSLSDVGTALGQLVIQAMLGFSTLAMYAAMVELLAVGSWPTGPGGWVLGFVFLEFLFYWRHRAGHEVAAFWAIHAVHHQSPEFNLTVAQRVGYLQWLQTALFVWPAAVVGMPATMFAALFGAIHLYQFFIHTRLVGTLGPLEHVLMTPSLHRVHHGRNAAYLDTNYGFTLTLFDRLFGTLKREEEPVEYGTVAPLPSFDPVANNLDPWRDLAARMRQAGPARAVAVALSHPDVDPTTGTRAPKPIGPRQAPRESGSPPARRLGLILIAVASVLGLALVQLTPVWPAPWRVAVGLVVLALTVAATRLTSSPPGADPADQR